MKTTLFQQRHFVEQIQKAKLIEGIQMLRIWLHEHGYEDPECSHTTVFRESGICTACGELPS